jgi:hypothetical protein
MEPSRIILVRTGQCKVTLAISVKYDLSESWAAPHSFYCSFLVPRTLQIQGTARRLVFRCWKLTVKLDRQNSTELQVIYGDSCVQMHPKPCVIFRDMLRSCWPAERPDWRITSLRMSMTSYSVCLQLRSLSEGRCFQLRDFFCCQCLIPVFMYACRTWSRTARNGHTLRALEKRVPRRILGHKREEDLRRGWWKSGKEDHKLRCSLDISRIMISGLRWLECIDCMGEIRRV